MTRRTGIHDLLLGSIQAQERQTRICISAGRSKLSAFHSFRFQKLSALDIWPGEELASAANTDASTIKLCGVIRTPVSFQITDSALPNTDGMEKKDRHTVNTQLWILVTTTASPKEPASFQKESSESVAECIIG
jgi:hypothetical protein